jgi:hypothetical protein
MQLTTHSGNPLPDFLTLSLHAELSTLNDADIFTKKPPITESCSDRIVTNLKITGLVMGGIFCTVLSIGLVPFTLPGMYLMESNEKCTQCAGNVLASPVTAAITCFEHAERHFLANNLTVEAIRCIGKLETNDTTDLLTQIVPFIEEIIEAQQIEQLQIRELIELYNSIVDYSIEELISDENLNREAILKAANDRKRVILLILNSLLNDVKNGENLADKLQAYLLGKLSSYTSKNHEYV